MFKLRFLSILILLTLITGCNGRKNEFRSGILNFQNRTIAWYTDKHHIGYALSFPKADSVSDSLVITKKNIALVQKVSVNGKTYNITSANELKDGITRILVNGKLFENLKNTYLVEKNGTVQKAGTIPPLLRKAITEASRSTPYPKAADPLFWLILGFVAQALFTSRMVAQWYSSEKAKKSVVPVIFWYLSISGSTLLLSYAIYRQDPVFILGQSAGLLVYFRNLWLIYREKIHHKKKASTV